MWHSYNVKIVVPQTLHLSIMISYICMQYINFKKENNSAVLLNLRLYNNKYYQSLKTKTVSFFGNMETSDFSDHSYSGITSVSIHRGV